MQPEEILFLIIVCLGALVLALIPMLPFIIIIVIHFKRRRNQRKCHNCNQLSLKLIKKEEISRDMSTKSVKKEIKDEKGRVIGIVDVNEPVTVIKYLVTYKCNDCGEIIKKIETY